jgi:hypothetical protein
MADGVVGVKQNFAPDRLIDNEVLDLGAGPVYRQRVSVGNALVPSSYDHITLGYTGDDLTSVIYRQGGAAGTVVATLTLGYTDGILTTVART